MPGTAIPPPDIRDGHSGGILEQPADIKIAAIHGQSDDGAVG